VQAKNFKIQNSKEEIVESRQWAVCNMLILKAKELDLYLVSLFIIFEDMVTVIKRGASIKEIDNALAKLKNSKKFDAYKYLGTIKLKQEPLEIQKRMRDEWE